MHEPDFNRRKLSDFEVKRTVANFISKKHEGTNWDFKKCWHGNNADLIHDIICMANNLEDNLSYLIIGIDESNDYKTVNVKEVNSNRKNTQQINDLLVKLNWAFNMPYVEVKEIELNNSFIDVVIIKSVSKNQPYFLLQRYESNKSYINAGAIYSRTVDSNTAKNGTASLHITNELWKRHFGLDATPLDRFNDYLLDSDGWNTSLEQSKGEKEFYKQFPEFTIEEIFDEHLNGYEYYHYLQTNHDPTWSKFFVRYHQTVIYSAQGAILDGGRYTTVVPERAFISTPTHNFFDAKNLSYTYCYFIIDSTLHRMHQHFYKDDYDDERIAHDKFVRGTVFYENEEERLKIEQQLKDELAAYEDSLNAITPFVYIPEDLPETARRSYIDSLRIVRRIQDLLEEKRKQSYEFKLHIHEDYTEQTHN